MQKQYIIILIVIGVSFFISIMAIAINIILKLQKWLNEKPVTEFSKVVLMHEKSFDISENGDYSICIYMKRELLRTQPFRSKFIIKDSNNQIVKVNDGILNWRNISDFEMKYKIFINSTFSVSHAGKYTLSIQNSGEIREGDLIIVKKSLKLF